ncbi:MAG: hypothetical protein RXR20_19640 [Paraburkholderia sp.]|jgi:hypothetical protein|nr:hypothetical protein [Burkholderia sp. 4M9327F10]
MKKLLFALTLAAVTVGGITTAYAGYHRPVCQKVWVNHHWEEHCH